LEIRIVPTHEIPIFRQIMTQIREAIASGRAQVGQKLPSHRELATQLVIAPLTVKKAYDELEREGLLETRRGRGTFVKERHHDSDAEKLERERLRDDARHLLQRARLSGTTLEHIQALLVEIDHQLDAERR
jgi:GntR family transcriptional regulator